MDVVSFCPLRVSALSWQPRPGTHALTVICKATFELRPGESPLALEQQAPCEADVHASDDPRRSLRAASDLVPFKRTADVLVVGHAHAPHDRPVMSLVARLSVGALDKAIEVHTNRAWAPNGTLVAAGPFARMPLDWELSARSPHNPVGIAFDAPADAHGFRPIPNLLPLGCAVRSPQEVIPAVGFGPIGSRWPSRAALLGRHAAGWDHRTWNAGPLPADFDGAFFNAAPVDQQMPELRGDETIVLEHLHPMHARLTTRLARIIPQATVRREDNQVEQTRLRCDTLCVDADRGIATLVWRGVVLLARPAERRTVAVTMEGTAAPADTATRNAPPVPVPQFARETAHAPVDDGTGTLVAGLAPVPEAARPALPFAQDKLGMPIYVTAGGEMAGPRPQKPIDDGTGTLVAGLELRSSGAGDAVLPFGVGTQLDKSAAFDEPTQDARAIDVPPPPMIGPLAGIMERPVGDKPLAEARPAAAEQRAPVEPGFPPCPEPHSAPAAVELSIEQIATVAAELAEGRGERKKVLDAHGLREKIWRENERRWMTAIDEETARGVHTLRGAYDAAYVARVEQFRGPITLEEYARIVTGIERGRANQVLDALRIQQPALMPIARLWTKKVAKDMKLADAATRALRAARSA